jgi:hypothetical protein
VIVDPPLSGAVHDTTAPEFSGLATTDVDAPGVVYGVTDAEFADSTPVPAALTAETRNTYAVPLVSPVTVADADTDVPSSNVVHDTPASDEYSTTQSVTTDPLLPPAVHDNATCVLPATPATPVAAAGVVYGVTDAESADTGPVPAALVAETRNTYAVPLVSPVTVADAVAVVPSSNVVHVTPASDEYSTL